MSGDRCAHGKGADVEKCDRCYDAKYPRAIQDSAYQDGKAAGYAEAVADVVAWMAGDRDVPSMSPGGIAECITNGAHVGASKKEGKGS